MKKWIPLCCVNEGECAIVQQILLVGAMRRRLQDLGLMEGTKILCCKKASGGSPVAYWFCGTLIALRTQDAGGILVSVEGKP